jgi:hypothetical protein
MRPPSEFRASLRELDVLRGDKGKGEKNAIQALESKAIEQSERVGLIYHFRNKPNLAIVV